MATIKILLVEDEHLIRETTAEALRDEGFEVVEAFNGDHAARLLEANDDFDVLFTDVQMPGVMDGIEVALHARRRKAAIPVLVVSGLPVPAVHRMKTLDPPVAFMAKPYNVDHIFNKLRTWHPHV